MGNIPTATNGKSAAIIFSEEVHTATAAPIYLRTVLNILIHGAACLCHDCAHRNTKSLLSNLNLSHSAAADLFRLLANPAFRICIAN